MLLHTFLTGMTVGTLFGIINVIVIKKWRERKKVHGKHFRSGYRGGK